MIILDTNVVSTLMTPDPPAEVIAWLDSLPAEAIWTTSITVYEVQFGLAILPIGRRRDGLQAGFEAVLREDLEGRVIDFDAAAAAEAADLAANLRSLGQPIEVRDALIAGITAACGASLATRNARHFKNTGVTLVDPWAAA